MNPPTIVIAGGGTGGHVIPNIVIGKILRQRFPQIKVIHMGGKRSVEQHMFKTHHVHPLYTLHAQQCSGKRFWRKMLSLAGIVLDTVTSIIWFALWKPSLVIGVGGYVSIGPLVAAWLFRKPIILQEQNAIPGLANRWLSHLAQKILLGFASAQTHLGKHQKKCVVSGNFNLAHHPQFGRLRKTGHHGLRLLITGGSQGAQALNETLCKHLPLLCEQFSDLKVFWQCGPIWEIQLHQQLPKDLMEKRLEVVGFDAVLYQHYVEADLCITRAGALTIEDVLTSACPAIIVPYPFAAQNHQVYNAQPLVQAQGARLIRQDESGWQDHLLSATTELLTNKALRHQMSEHLRLLAATFQNTKVLTDTVQAYLSVS